jgi:Do/DeqQ family serine protease
MRRAVFLLLLTILVGFALYRCDRLGGLRPGGVPEKFTPASGPRLDPKDVQVLAALDAEYTRLVEAVTPSVVSITTSKRIRTNIPQALDPWELFFRQRGPRRQAERIATGLGSGVIVSKEGHILTNHHVIEGMEEIRVQLTDGRVLPARLIGSHEQTDTAVLSIQARDIQPLPFGDSDEVRVGQMVFAVGNPFGLQESVTQGIISGKGRRAMRDSGVEFLQTDAAVNRGNSGGPLLNLRGEIIGINSAIYSETGGWLGVSFAIPSNVARRTLESIIKTGRVVRGYLGVSMMNLTPELAQEFGVPDTRGALIAEIVPGSPAERAGLRPGDVIRSINGRALNDMIALRRVLADARVGERAELEIIRAGAASRVAVEIAEMPSDLAAPIPPAPGPGQ